MCGRIAGVAETLHTSCYAYARMLAQVCHAQTYSRLFLCRRDLVVAALS